MPLVDVIVPTRNNATELLRCLASLDAQTTKDLRVIVCVDGSTDDTLERLSDAKTVHPVVVRTHPGNVHRGRAATRNLALPALDSAYVVLVDSDMCLEPTAVGRHLAVASPTAASVGSVAYTNQDANLWARYISARRLNRFQAGDVLPHSQFLTANVALATPDLVTLGGFDEAIVGYGGEDVEFGYRYAATGRRIIANPAARAESFEPKSLETALAQLREYGASNLRYIHALHPEMPHTFGTDRLRSGRLRDRIFVAAMNPVNDWIAKRLVQRVPFPLQHLLINYMVVRAVCRGFAEGRG